MKRRNLIDIIERFQTQHALQEEREMKLRNDLGDEDEVLSGTDPTEPLVANLSGALHEDAERLGRNRLTPRNNNKFHHALTNQTKEN
jgi:hypothetical protein